ncbi:hypothetical protein [Mangrovimonas sp. TPBH4]|uniref:hypothetical protein n=1 Tax=Mangrovimonas sp. TPBH4 TaxID=1645914 RepID=UPI000A5408B6|nr:hypothetical protein [Mangrovimonas sp. TPBH4]
MENLNRYSQSAFKYGIIRLLLLINVFLYSSLFQKIQYSLESNFKIFDEIIGVLSLTTIIIGIIGFMKSMKGLKEPNTPKKIIGLIINSGITILFIVMIITVIAKLTMYFDSIQ